MSFQPKTHRADVEAQFQPPETSPEKLDRSGPVMATFLGGGFWPFDPRVEDIHIEDIAHSLARLCRFNGHCQDYVSIAEHSVLVSRIGPEEEALERLLHDAAEFAIGDIISPIKRHPQVAAVIKPIEENIERAIAAAFDLAYPWSPSVHLADRLVVEEEQRRNVARSWRGAYRTPDEPPEDAEPIELKRLEPEAAEALFLETFHELMLAREQRLERRKASVLEM